MLRIFKDNYMQLQDISADLEDFAKQTGQASGGNMYSETRLDTEMVTMRLHNLLVRKRCQMAGYCMMENKDTMTEHAGLDRPIKIFVQYKYFRFGREVHFDILNKYNEGAHIDT